MPSASLVVLQHAHAGPIDAAELDHRRGVAALDRLAQPFDRLLGARRVELGVEQQQPGHFQLGIGVARLRPLHGHRIDALRAGLRRRQSDPVEPERADHGDRDHHHQRGQHEHRPAARGRDVVHDEAVRTVEAPIGGRVRVGMLFIVRVPARQPVSRALALGADDFCGWRHG